MPDDLTPIEQAIWAAAYARTVYPLHVSESAQAVDDCVASASRYADAIVRQFREARARKDGGA